MTVYKKPQGILLKLTLENLEISGNFVLEIGGHPGVVYRPPDKYESQTIL